MPTCPKGHDSSTADYCEVCGTPIGGAAAGPQPTTAAPAASAPDAATACPQCGTPRTGRFCEVDGYDFVAADLGGGQSAPAPRPAQAAGPESTGRTAPATGPSWRVALAADRAYHDRILAMNGPDAAAMTFPAFYPERQFQLSGRQVLIGRRSRSRGIDPQIDLTGPPEDPGVSHSHALLVPGADGTWAVVDLDSANGTYLNEADSPLSANTPVTLHDGDRVHVGAWTHADGEQSDVTTAARPDRYPRLYAPDRWGWAGLDARFSTAAVPDRLVTNVHVVGFTGDRVVVCTDGRPGHWFLPGGTRESAESIPACVRRELVEEAGARLTGALHVVGAHDCHSDLPTPFRPHQPHPRKAWLWCHAEVAADSAPTNPADGEQVVEVRVVPVAEACRLVAADAAWLPDLVLLAAELRRGG